MNTLDQQKIVALAKKIVEGSTDIVEGCRQLVSLKIEERLRNDKDFLTIRGFESETDSFPIDEVRNQYDSEKLKKLDLELKKYLEEMKPKIINSCQSLIKKYS